MCSTPETFDIVPTTIDIESRKNLAQISKMLTQITSGSEYSEDSPAYLPVNDYVRKTIVTISTWLLEGWSCFSHPTYTSLHLSSRECARCRD